MNQPKDGIYFIARDEGIFEYVLEYLIYGELVTTIDKPSTLKKLQMDADFFLLPGLKAAASAQLLPLSTPVPKEKEVQQVTYCRSTNGSLAGSGYCWQWGTTETNPPLAFQKKTKSYSNDTIVIKKVTFGSTTSMISVLTLFFLFFIEGHLPSDCTSMRLYHSRPIY